MKHLPFCSVVIPAYNEEKYIDDCLKSLRNQSYPKDRFEVIVVDNGSLDTTVQRAKTHTDYVYVLENGNVGAVRNYGVTKALGEFIAFVDSDCVVERDWLITAIEKLLRNDNLVLGGVLVSNTKSNWIERYWLLEGDTSHSHQKDLMGSCIIIHKTVFDAIGGFNEKVTSGEDSDLSDRLRKAGNIVIISPDLKVRHLGNPSTIYHFIARQAWHADNYLLDISNSMVDKVFYLVILYITLSFFVLTSVFSSLSLILAIAAQQVPPIILSAKRITRSKYKPKGIKDVLLILTLDNFYLVGRSIGLLRGVAFKLLGKKPK